MMQKEGGKLPIEFSIIHDTPLEGEGTTSIPSLHN